MSHVLTSSDLETFIRQKMRMSHIYQPVMLRVLLAQGGQATIEGGDVMPIGNGVVLVGMS